ncbi:MAG: choice-of-anchor D domain-containing protein, partial [Gammaproteobacteria bacterium]
LSTSPTFQGSGTQIWPGGILTLSANGDQSGSGVLWATVATSGNASDNPPVPGELHAFDAADVSNEIWNSSMNAARDGFGNYAKFVPPVVANGKVYVATWSNQVAVYGLLSSFTVSSNSLPFGNEKTNTATAPMPVTVTNTGTMALPITNIALSTAGVQPFSQTNTCGASIAVGASCTINVVFNPSSLGAASATLSINAGNGTATQGVALSGNGVSLSYSVSATSLAFGTQTLNVASAPMPVTVTNTGQATLSILSVALSSGGTQPFTQANTCGTSLAVGASCNISVVFNPAASGSASAALSINTGNGAGMQTVALSGTGAVLSFSVSAQSLAFGTQALNAASAPMPVTVANTGQAVLPIGSIALSNPGTQPFSQSNDCGTSIAVGAACTISIVF